MQYVTKSRFSNHAIKLLTVQTVTDVLVQLCVGIINTLFDKNYGTYVTNFVDYQNIISRRLTFVEILREFLHIVVRICEKSCTLY